MKIFYSTTCIALALFLGSVGTGYADNHVNEEVAKKLSMDLPNNMGIVPYGEEGTMLYVVTKPSNPEKGIFLSMQ